MVADDKAGTLEIHHQPTGAIMAGEELKAQILYILCNVGSWRGERAKEVKKVLKVAAEER